MVQNKKTGVSANRFGRETATKIVRLIGAKKLSKNSNEVTYNEIRSVIKCARGTIGQLILYVARFVKIKI